MTLPALNSAVNSQIAVSGNSVLTLQQGAGQLTGFTFYGGCKQSSRKRYERTPVDRRLNSGPAGVPLARPQHWHLGNTLSGLSPPARLQSPRYSIFDEYGYTYIAAPTTLVWNGGGSDTNWSSPANWGGTTPLPGQWLAFASPLRPADNYQRHSGQAPLLRNFLRQPGPILQSAGQCHSIVRRRVQPERQ